MGIGWHADGAAFVAADVHYLRSGGARAAAIVSADASFADVLAERTQFLPDVLPYRPGEFYLRELPPLRAVLDGLNSAGLLVVDDYADLDPDGRPGLGAHAHAEFGIPVIGVAKTAFCTASHAIPVQRGTSARPLFITAAGMPALTPQTSSGIWPAATGCPTPSAAPTPSHAPACPSIPLADTTLTKHSSRQIRTCATSAIVDKYAISTGHADAANLDQKMLGDPVNPCVAAVGTSSGCSASDQCCVQNFGPAALSTPAQS
jgi:deoxyribonuclease V